MGILFFLLIITASPSAGLIQSVKKGFRIFREAWTPRPNFTPLVFPELPTTTPVPTTTTHDFSNRANRVVYGFFDNDPTAIRSEPRQNYGRQQQQWNAEPPIPEPAINEKVLDELEKIHYVLAGYALDKLFGVSSKWPYEKINNVAEFYATSMKRLFGIMDSEELKVAYRIMAPYILKHNEAWRKYKDFKPSLKELELLRAFDELQMKHVKIDKVEQGAFNRVNLTIIHLLTDREKEEMLRLMLKYIKGTFDPEIRT